MGMLMSWLVSLAAHVSFPPAACAHQLAALPMRSPFGAWGSVLGFVLIIVAFLETVWHSRLTLISGGVYMVGLTAAYFLLRKKSDRRLVWTIADSRFRLGGQLNLVAEGRRNINRAVSGTFQACRRHAIGPA